MGVRELAIVACGLVAAATGCAGAGGGGPEGSATIAVNAPLGAAAVNRHARPAPAARLAAAAAPVHLRIAAAGDFLIHSPLYQRALSNGGGRRYDFRPMFTQIRPIISAADLGICHIETPLVAGTPHSYPIFRTPPALADAAKATGFDVCSTASNHSLDAGQSGIDSTRAALRRVGIRFAGSYSSAAQQRRPTIVTVKGVRIAFLSYTEMTNGLTPPHLWSVNIATAPRILAEARRARRAGAHAVIVNLHWGNEYVHEPSSFQADLAHRLTRSPLITAVIGQHVHVVQPIRRVNGRFVVFGEGNLVSNQSASCCPAPTQDGLIALLDLTVDDAGARVTRVSYVPTWVRHPDYLVVPVGVGLRKGLADSGSLRASYDRTVGVVGRGPRLAPVPARLP